MKQVFLKDIRTLLGSRIMGVLALLVLQVAFVPAICMKNEDFVATTIQCMVFCMVLLVLFYLYEGANLYLRNLQKLVYFHDFERYGYSVWKVIVYKQLITGLSILAVVALFVGALAIDIFVITRAFPEVAKDLLGFDFQALLGDTSGGYFLPVLLAVLNVVLVISVVTSWSYWAVGLTFAYFARQRYAGLSALFVFMSGALFLVSMDNKLAGHFTSLGGRTVVLVIYLAVLAGMTFGHWKVLRKKLLPALA